MKQQIEEYEKMYEFLDNTCNTEIERISLNNLLAVHGIKQINTYREYCQNIFDLDSNMLDVSDRNAVVLMDSIDFNAATAIDMLNNVLTKLKDIAFKAQAGLLPAEYSRFFKLIDNFLVNTDFYYVNSPYLRVFATKTNKGENEQIPSLNTYTPENVEKWLEYEREHLRTSIISHMPNNRDILCITENVLNPFNEEMVCDIMTLSICYNCKNWSGEFYKLLTEHKIEEIPEEHE